jgi:hypothetical protein
MDVADVRLPDEDAEDEWCELLFHTAQPEVGKNWTDADEIHLRFSPSPGEIFRCCMCVTLPRGTHTGAPLTGGTRR